MKRYIKGTDRETLCFPQRLEDYIEEDNPVRVVDLFIESLDLAALGFKRIPPSPRGAPCYHPAVLLKIYVYSYLNREQSGRRLERECRVNVEMMWLTGKLSPDHKTITDFRKDNGAAIIQACRRFEQVFGPLKLIDPCAPVAIDSSKFKANNNRDRNFTEAKMAKRLGGIEKRIARYLAELDEADRWEAARVEAQQKRIAQMQAEHERLKALEQRLQLMPDKQLSLTDPDCRSMATSSKGSGIVGYNVQTVVESQHHLIVAHEVTNIGHDRGQLYTMAAQALEALGGDTLSAVLDKGYYSGEQIRACEQEGIEVYIAKAQTSGSKKAGRFSKEDFVYEAEGDQYRCPRGAALSYSFSTVRAGKTFNVYTTNACQRCAIKARCTTGKVRRIKRWEDEAILERVDKRLERNPEMMKLRRQTVEHPFGTLKFWMGSAHFLTTKLTGVRTEMSLHILSYNFKRVLNIVGMGALVELLSA